MKSHKEHNSKALSLSRLHAATDVTCTIDARKITAYKKYKMLFGGK